MNRAAFLLTLLACQPPLLAQEIHDDHTVTFKLKAPEAKAVSVSGDFPKGGAMTKNDDGEWSLTVGPLEPDIYSYKILADGKPAMDPQNHTFKPERQGLSNAFEVRGETPAIWDARADRPAGLVHAEKYKSKTLDAMRAVSIYTPPGYNKDKEKRFPVLYLLHGSGDNAATWSVFGRAGVILDNLIADGKAVPMIVVMPNGHTAPPMPRDAPGAAEARTKNMASFEHDLLEDLIPYVNGRYRTKTGREDQAIIGLSMGGNQSLIIGLNHLDLFAWVGGMSSAVREPETQLAPFLANAASANEKLKLLWLGVGKEDRLLPDNQKLDALLRDKGVKHTYVESEGAHSWHVWRRFLAEFAPLLFR